jgi:hypothetical protein
MMSMTQHHIGFEMTDVAVGEHENT